MRRSLVIACLVGCQSVPLPEVESWADASWVLWRGPTETRVIALVIDDRTAADAAQLRLDIREGLRTSLAASASACRDPSAWQSIDWQLFLVLPSRTGGERIVGPDEVPAFALQRFTDDAAAALADAAMDELEARTVPPDGAPFLPLEAVERVLTVARGASAPTSAAEDRLAAQAQRLHAWLQVALAAATDDEGDLPVDSYVVAGDMLLDLAVVAPFDSESSCRCELTIEPHARITGWAARMEQLFHFPCVRGWPCREIPLGDTGLFQTLHTGAGCLDFCASRPVRIDEMGGAACTVTVRSYQGACDTALGWLDPLASDGTRRPATGMDEQGAYHACEIPQLEGAAREACRHDLGCAGCASGWCQTMVPELHRDCAAGDHAADLRFTGGSMAGVHARYEIACELVP